MTQHDLGLIKEFLVSLAMNGGREEFLFVCRLFAEYPELVTA